jgi:hypothetical protein
MLKLLRSMQCAAFVLLGTNALAADDAIKDVQTVPLHPGLNVVKAFLPNGDDATILQVWRDNGNAHGYTIFSVMRQPKPGIWEIIDVGGKDTIEDVPHTGEDNVTSVRFARGVVDRAKASLLIVAQRNLAGTQSYYDRTTTTISYYRLIDASDKGPGTTPFTFQLVEAVHPKQLYCNSDLALSKEAGLPLLVTYGGPNTVDGCFPEKR